MKSSSCVLFLSLLTNCVVLDIRHQVFVRPEFPLILQFRTDISTKVGKSGRGEDDDDEG